MFDVGFSELVMVGLVSLLVIGPERLPKVARIAGYWLGKTRHMVAVMKMEIKQELHEEEIRQALSQHASMDELRSIVDETTEVAQSVKSSVENMVEVKPGLAEPHEPR